MIVLQTFPSIFRFQIMNHNKIYKEVGKDKFLKIL